MPTNLPTTQEVYAHLEAVNAFDTWEFPNGPWGWHPQDGTSLAPTVLERAAHVAWYHDIVQG